MPQRSLQGFIYRLIYTAAVAVGAWLPYPLSAQTADEVHWTITGQNSVTFNWRGDAEVIRFGRAPDDDASSVAATVSMPSSDTAPGPFWQADLTELATDSLYYYRIGDASEGAFRTPPPRGQSGFSVYAQGDIGTSDYYPNLPGVQQLIADGAPAFVLALGDLAYADAHGLEHITYHFNEVGVWSADAAYMPVWGNHDWDSGERSGGLANLRNFKDRFELPNPQTSPSVPAASCCGEDWYWFDYGNVRFIAYPEPWPGALTDWRYRAEPLMQAAQDDDDLDFIVTFGHRPAYSSGLHPGSAGLVNKLNELGAAYDKYVLNLAGHSHNYERTWPQSGVIHLTIGTGGSTLQVNPDGPCLWFDCVAPDWSAMRAFRHGALKLRFESQRIEASFVCGPDAPENDYGCTPGQALDAFVIGERSLVLRPTDDATVEAAAPDDNFGNAAKLELDADPQQALLIKFDLAGVDVAALNSAELRLYNVNPSNRGGDVYPLLDDAWSEDSVTWNTLPAVGEPAATLGPVDAGEWVRIDVSDLIDDDGAFGVLMTSSSSNGADYASRENATFAPRLVVDAADDGPVASETLSFVPFADATIKAGEPDRNFGGWSKLEADGSPEEHFLLKFAVAELAGREILGARLRLYNVNASGRGGVVYRAADGPWSETGVTWNGAPAAVSQIGALGAVEENRWYDVDLGTPLISDGTLGLRISTSASNGADYASRENAALAPRLLITVAAP